MFFVLCIYGNSLLFLVVVVVVVISSQLLTHWLTNPCFFERMLDITIKDYCFLHHLQSVYSTILVAFLFHQLKIRTSLTGKHHGSEGRNCSDFCSTFHFTNPSIGFLPSLADIAFKQYLSFTHHFRQPSFFTSKNIPPGQESTMAA